MQKVEADITPSVMKWARLRARMEIKDVAKKLDRSPEEVENWENGSSKPTIPQLRKISALYKKALAVFFLEEPPLDFRPIEDYRLIKNSENEEYSFKLEALIEDTVYKQEWLKEYFIAEGEPELGFVGSCNTQTSPTELAFKIRKTLNISINDQVKCKNRGEALMLWIRKTEEAGVFVIRSGDIELAEARGFALCDKYAPYMFVNSNDGKAAQIFTIAHELVHIWLDKSGVSNIEGYIGDAKKENEFTEIYANKVASEILLNTEYFLSRWNNSSSISLEDKIESASKHFKISEEVIARKLHTLNRISISTYNKLRSKYNEKWSEIDEMKKYRRKPSGNSPIYYPLMRMKLGMKFIQTAISAYKSKAISGREVASLLNVKINNINSLLSS